VPVAPPCPVYRLLVQKPVVRNPSIWQAHLLIRSPVKLQGMRCGGVEPPSIAWDCVGLIGHPHG